MSNTVWSMEQGWHDGEKVTVEFKDGKITTQPEKMPHLELLDGKPVSSCCQAEVQRKCDYTDTHVFVVEELDTDETGKIVAGSYRFVKTYDGMDGVGPTFFCSNCDLEIDDDEIDWDEK